MNERSGREGLRNTSAAHAVLQCRCAHVEDLLHTEPEILTPFLRVAAAMRGERWTRESTVVLEPWPSTDDAAASFTLRSVGFRDDPPHSFGGTVDLLDEEGWCVVRITPDVVNEATVDLIVTLLDLVQLAVSAARSAT